MSIIYNADQQAIAEQAQRVLQARASKERLLSLIERSGEFDEPFWEAAVQQGWTAIGIPEEHGGIDLGLTELGIVAEACGAQTSGAPFLPYGYAAAVALQAVQHDEACARWLPLLAAGEAIACLALREGSEILPARPAVRFAGGVLTGRKDAVACGTRADIAVVWAEGDNGPVLVLAELAGVRRETVASFDNARLFADLDFAATPALVLAEGAAARALALDLLARVAVVLAHEQVGGSRALMMTARDYALERKAFGQPIGAFQSVKHRIAEMYCMIEIARANAIHAAATADAGGADFLTAAADARLSCSECYDSCSRDATQVHGAIGVTWELGLHLHVRRTRSFATEAGNGYFWEDTLAARLLGEAA